MHGGRVPGLPPQSLRLFQQASPYTASTVSAFMSVSHCTKLTKYFYETILTEPFNRLEHQLTSPVVESGRRKDSKNVKVCGEFRWLARSTANGEVVGSKPRYNGGI